MNSGHTPAQRRRRLVKCALPEEGGTVERGGHELGLSRVRTHTAHRLGVAPQALRRRAPFDEAPHQHVAALGRAAHVRVRVREAAFEPILLVPVVEVGVHNF